METSNVAQTSLFKRADHSNLGREWENALIAVHDWYRMQRRADVVKNPSEWVFVGPQAYMKVIRNCDPGMLAITANGRHLIRSRSDVDFSGGGRGFSICFDAKHCEQKLYPLANLTDHQIRRLIDSSRCGCISGFMLRMEMFNRVFFIPAAYADDRKTALQRQGSKRAKAGTASLSISDLEQNCVEIHRNHINGLWDWLPALVRNDV